MSTRLLNDDGRASMATAFMTSHHGFRRDTAWLDHHLARAPDANLAEAWKHLHDHLVGHHTAEDHGVFPGLLEQHPELAATITRLEADHHALDALLARGDGVFVGAVDRQAARATLHALRDLLLPHLALEERDLIPHLRDAFAFPSPETDAAATMYADGFAWSTYGVAPEVLSAIRALLPDNVAAHFDAARERFRAYCERLWGPMREGATTTSDADLIDVRQATGRPMVNVVP